MSAYYNEIDPFAAAWLRELIKAGLIADGEVDTRSIADVRADDLRGFVQCHWFGGIGGWSYALRLAGWPDDREVWTGSCPCQPFSSAGQGAGADDSRDLWPTWFKLIAQCRPHVVFGEQVASPDGLGWLDRVHADLEGADYAVGAVDLCAASVGAFHIRQRIWFVADSASGASSGVHRILGTHATIESNEGGEPAHRGADGLMAHADARGQRIQRPTAGDGLAPTGLTAAGFWSDATWLPCRDGKARPTQPEIFPLAARLPGDVGLLRGAGNSIVPQVAQAFIEAYLDSMRTA